MVHRTVSMSKFSLSDSVKDILKEVMNDSVGPYHLLPFYTLFVDVTSDILWNNHPVDMLTELKKTQYVIYHSVDHSVLVQTLMMIKC